MAAEDIVVSGTGAGLAGCSMENNPLPMTPVAADEGSTPPVEAAEVPFWGAGFFVEFVVVDVVVVVVVVVEEEDDVAVPGVVFAVVFGGAAGLDGVGAGGDCPSSDIPKILST